MVYRINNIPLFLFLTLFICELLVPSFVSAYADVNILLVGFVTYTIFVVLGRSLNRSNRSVSPIPGLRFSDFFRKPISREALPFPLDQTEGVRYFYFARNGIWHGLQTAGIKAGDEILMPELNSTIEVQVVRQYGAIPIFYKVILRQVQDDNDKNNDFTPDWEDVESKVTSKTKIFYLIHYLGVPNDIAGARAFCKKYNLIFFEDAAFGFLSEHNSPQSPLTLRGGVQQGKPLGSFGDVAIMVMRKTVPVPNGAALIVNGSLRREILNSKPEILNKSEIQNFKQQVVSPDSDPGSRNKNKRKKIFLFSFLCLDPDLRRDDGRERGNEGSGFFFSTIHDLIERLGYGLGLDRVLPFLLKLFRGKGRIFGLRYVSPGSGIFDQKCVHWPMSKISQRLLERFDYALIQERLLENYRTIQRLATSAGYEFFPRAIEDGTVPNEVILFFRDAQTRDRVFDMLSKRRIGISKMWHWNENIVTLRQAQGDNGAVRQLVGRGLALPMHADLTEKHFENLFEAIARAET